VRTGELAALLLLALILGPRPCLLAGGARADPCGRTDPCHAQLQLDSKDAVTVGSTVNFHLLNDGIETITLRSTAPWLIREGTSDGPIVYAPVSAAVLEEVSPSSWYPTSGEWSWTPDREGNYYIEVAYECASAYPLLTHLRITVSPRAMTEFSSLVAILVVLGIGAALVGARYQRRRSRLLHAAHG